MDQQMLERVLHLSSRMAETRQLTPLLEYALGEAMSLVGAEYGYIVLTSPDGSLDFRIRQGPDRTNAQDQISMSILNKVIQTRLPLIVDDAITSPDWQLSKSVADLRLRSVLCVPLIARGDVIGTIYVENRSIKGQFHADDLTLLTLFANQAAVSILNATMNDDLEAGVAARTRELEQAKTEVEQSWAQAVEANRVRTVLLGNVAHDLRAPLSIVIQSLQLLQEGLFGDLNAQQQDWVAKSLDAAIFVLNLTNDVFDLTKIEMGGLQLHQEAVDLGDFLRQFHRVALGLPWSSGVVFELDIRSDMPHLMLDPIRIDQVLMNLISNALKFTSRGSVTLHAEYSRGNKLVTIGVTDTGEGIPPDKMANLFQRFQLIDKNKERRRLGSGLGLAICKELVEMHGGQIRATSTPGFGSQFSFTLPVEPAQDAPPAA